MGMIMNAGSRENMNMKDFYGKVWLCHTAYMEQKSQNIELKT